MSLSNILRREYNFIGHILGKHCLLLDANGAQMREVKVLERRKIQFLDDLRKIRR